MIEQGEGYGLCVGANGFTGDARHPRLTATVVAAGLLNRACGCQKVSRTLGAAGSPRETLIQMIGGWRYDCSI